MYSHERKVKMYNGPMYIKFKCTGGFPPKRGSLNAAGIDLYNNDRDIELNKGDKEFIDTKTAFSIPDGYVGLVFPRSGLGSKGLRLSNSVGVIDSDYKDSVKAAIEYNGEEPLTLEIGTRFCQIVFVPYLAVELIATDELEGPDRGGGFGSTGEK